MVHGAAIARSIVTPLLCPCRELICVVLDGANESCDCSLLIGLYGCIVVQQLFLVSVEF